jgi:DUF1680 family protein
MRFHDVADYFFYEVTTARSYVTGGTSNAEAWLAPPRRLAAEWKLSVNTAECCCAYNMLKLARQLYSWNPDYEYRYTDVFPTVAKDGKLVVTEKALNQFYEANLIARVDYADILYIAPILIFVGVVMAGVTAYVTLRLYVRR